MPNDLSKDLLEDPNINEFKSLLIHLFPKDKIPNITKQNNLLTFNCLFPEDHTDNKNANAYAFKLNGIYRAKCHGVVCDNSYTQLNKRLKEIQLSDIQLKASKFFNADDEGVTVFLAPTGWGKTETIADECVRAINDNKKLVVVLQNIEAINRLIGRIKDRTGESEKVKDLIENDLIYKFVAEDKDEYKTRFMKARVIITHHYYFKHCGDIITKFQSTVDLLKMGDYELIIDEAHTLIELATRIDLSIGGLYEKQTYDGLTTYRKNRKSLLQEEIADSGLTRKTSIIEARLNEYGNVTLTANAKLYDTVSYIDIYEAIRKRLKLVKQFKEGYMVYQYYTNPRPREPDINSLDNTKGVLNDLLEPCEFAVVGINVGDDIKRKNIGEFSVTLHHYNILNEILNNATKVILTTATMNDYHYTILDKVVKYKVVDIKDKIDKVKTLVLLRNSDQNSSRKRSKILQELNEMNIKSLIFMPTIDKAKKYLPILNNSMLNDNGIYSVGERQSVDDYIDNKKRNVTLVGLESSVAKGYNYFEETQSTGFEVVYFDNEPVSPPTIKKYPNSKGELEDYKSNYNISTFAQAIGRGFRADKEVMCLCFNKIDDAAFDDVVTYLEMHTNSRVIVDELTLTNLKISINSLIHNSNYEQIREKLTNNQLFTKIYEEE